MKKTIVTLMAIVFAITANAQYNVDGHKFWDNWSLGLEGGITTNAHDWNSPKGFVAGINATKAITPVVSFEFGFTVGVNNG